MGNHFSYYRNINLQNYVVIREIKGQTKTFLIFFVTCKSCKQDPDIF